MTFEGRKHSQTSIRPGGPRVTRVAGFSLVELLIVLLVISVVAGIGINRFANSASNQQLDAGVQRVMADIELARAKAIALAANGTVQFDTATGHYTMSQLPDVDRPDQAYTVDLSQDPYRVAITDIDLDGAGSSTLTFDPYGRPVLAASCGTDTPLLVALTVRRRTIVVWVDAATGQPHAD